MFIETIVIDNAETQIRRDSEGRINANDAHRASGGAKKKRINYFLQLKKTTTLVEKLSAAGKPAPVFTTIGGEDGGSTWMHEDLFFAYCAWIDNDFYAAVAKAFGHAARGDGDAAVEAARSVARIKSIVVRKGATDAWKRAGAVGSDYAWATNMGYVVTRGKTAKEIREEKGLDPKANVREHSSAEELAKDGIWEYANIVALTSDSREGFRSQLVRVAAATQNFFDSLR